MDTKAAFECKWDMLYDPPLTQRVPPGVSHPAEAAVGLPLATLLGGPLLEDLAAVRAAQRVEGKTKKLKEALRLVRQTVLGAKRLKTPVRASTGAHLAALTVGLHFS